MKLFTKTKAFYMRENTQNEIDSIREYYLAKLGKDTNLAMIVNSSDSNIICECIHYYYFNEVKKGGK